MSGGKEVISDGSSFKACVQDASVFSKGESFEMVILWRGDMTNGDTKSTKPAGHGKDHRKEYLRI